MYPKNQEPKKRTGITCTCRGKKCKPHHRDAGTSWWWAQQEQRRENSVAWPENPSEIQQGVPSPTQKELSTCHKFSCSGLLFFLAAPQTRGAQQSLPTKTGKERGQANCAGTHSETPPPRKAKGCRRAAKVSQAKRLLKSKSVTRK